MVCSLKKTDSKTQRYINSANGKWNLHFALILMQWPLWLRKGTMWGFITKFIDYFGSLHVWNQCKAKLHYCVAICVCDYKKSYFTCAITLQNLIHILSISHFSQLLISCLHLCTSLLKMILIYKCQDTYFLIIYLMEWKYHW